MRRLSYILISAAVLLTIVGCSSSVPVQETERARVFITFDPELDDNNSLIRYVLAANQFETEGIVLTSGRYHWKGDGSGRTQFLPGEEYDVQGLGPQTEWRWGHGENVLYDILDAYEECYPNLKVHDPNYPTPEELRSKACLGNIYYQADYSYDSPGSDLLQKVLLDDDPRPVFVQAWGGSSTIARALYCIEQKYKGTDEWEAIYKKVTDKMYFSGGDQDGTLTNYIQPNWPDIKRPGAGGTRNPIAYNGQRSLPDEYVYYFEPEWVEEHLRVGPFGKLQRVWGDGKQFVPGDKWDYFGEAKSVEELIADGYILWSYPEKPGSFLAEGDTGGYLNMVDNGLRAWKDPSWGGWSGRTAPGTPRRQSSFGPISFNPKSLKAPVARPRVPYTPSEIFPDFFPEVMNTLAAHFDWSVTPNYEDANHYPVVNGPWDITATPGETVKIKAKVADPDGDEVTLKWMQFKVGTYEGAVAVDNPTSAVTTFTVPADAKSGDTIHLVLQATDNGDPVLVRYLRTVVTVK